MHLPRKWSPLCGRGAELDSAYLVSLSLLYSQELHKVGNFHPDLTQQDKRGSEIVSNILFPITGKWQNQELKPVDLILKISFMLFLSEVHWIWGLFLKHL